MGINEFLHMNKGDGELSYVQNSFLQNGVWQMNQHIIESAIDTLISEGKGLIKGLNVADLGCGVGQVPLALVTMVMEIMQRKSKELKQDENHQVPKLHMYMNDLPSNDFSLLFKNLLNLEVLKGKDDLDDEPLCYLMGVPGSYYDVLFPHNSLDFVHSNLTLQWLSKAPSGLYDDQGMSINKGNIHIGETSPKPVAEAYWAQFEQYFNRFLKCRSKEVVPNGFMLLTLTGSPCPTESFTRKPFLVTTILTRALNCLVSEGLIKEEMVDNFEFPLYLANTNEIESIVQKEGSFSIEYSKTETLNAAPEIEDKWERSQILTNFVRAFSESIISQHFGEEIITPLYDKFKYYGFQELAQRQVVEHYPITILLRKK